MKDIQQLLFLLGNRVQQIDQINFISYLLILLYSVFASMPVNVREAWIYLLARDPLTVIWNVNRLASGNMFIN